MSLLLARAAAVLAGVALLSTAPVAAIHLAHAHHDQTTGSEHGCGLCRLIEGHVALVPAVIDLAAPASVDPVVDAGMPAPRGVELPRARGRSPPSQFRVS